MTPAQVERLEELCDLVNERLEPLRSFVLPGGSEAAARLHVARAVCAGPSAARSALAETHGVNPAALAYLNRLSDLLFILARAANPPRVGSEPLWRPGGERSGQPAVSVSSSPARSSPAFSAAVVGLVLGSLRLPAVLCSRPEAGERRRERTSPSARRPRSRAASRTPAPGG